MHGLHFYNAYIHFFFFATWDGAPLGVGALRKLRSLRIGSGGTGYRGLQCC